MRECLGTKTIPALPALETVVPPPDFKDMSWHQVRTYIEAGYEAGKSDPYPMNYPAHLKWVSEEEQAKINARKVIDLSLMDNKKDDDVKSEYLFAYAGVKEIDDIESLPDSDDSFWAPAVPHQYLQVDQSVGQGAASSSMLPPPQLVKDEEEADGQAENAFGELDPTLPFPWPASDHVDDHSANQNDSSSSMHIEEDFSEDGNAFSQPPVPEDFLGVDWFAHEEDEGEDVDVADVDSELERELVEALEAEAPLVLGSEL